MVPADQCSWIEHPCCKLKEYSYRDNWLCSPDILKALHEFHPWSDGLVARGNDVIRHFQFSPTSDWKIMPDLWLHTHTCKSTKLTPTTICLEKNAITFTVVLLAPFLSLFWSWHAFRKHYSALLFLAKLLFAVHEIHLLILKELSWRRKLQIKT